MSNRLGLVAVVALVLSLTAAQQSHGVMISLSTTPSDLSTVSANDSVTINAVLSGLVSGAELEFFGTTVSYDETLFGAPAAVTAGPIIPDASGFLSTTPAPGLVDGFFDSFFTPGGDPIVSNGVFFSFEVVALRDGSGVFDVDFVGEGFVPEPASAMLVLMGFAGVGMIVRRRGAV